MTDYAAIRITYLMYVVVWIYIFDLACLMKDDDGLGLDRRHRVIRQDNIIFILLISCDTIRMVFVGTLKRAVA